MSDPYPRTRSKTSVNESKTVSLKREGSQWGGSPPDNPPGPYELLSEPWENTFQSDYVHHEMSDVVTPGFKKLQAQGRIINNPMTQTTTTISEVPITCSIEGKTHAETWDLCNYKLSGSFPLSAVTTQLVGPGFSDTAKSQAVTEAHARIGHDEILFNALVAELDKTIGGITDIFVKVRNIIHYVRRKQLKKLKQEISFKELEEVYLNARYNLRPLYYDTQGLLEVLNKPQVADKRHTFRSSKVPLPDITSDSVQHKIAEHAQLLVYTFHLNRKVVSQVEARAGVLTVMDELTYAYILGLDRLAETAWELLPLSFIADWFINVGDIIGAWSPKAGIEKLASWVTTSQSTIQTVVCNDVTVESPGEPWMGYYYTPSSISWSGGIWAETVTEKIREPDPSRAFFPSVDLNLDLLKLYDLGLIVRNLRMNASKLRG